MVMNKEKWESLPKDLQKIMTDVSNEWIDRQGRAWDTSDEEGEAFVKDLAKTFVELNREQNTLFVQAMQPVLDDYVKATEGKGLPGGRFLADVQDMLQQQ